MVSVGCLLLTFWLASVVLLQQSCLSHRLQRLCTVRSATQHSPERCVPMCGVDGKRFHGDIKIFFETFLLPPCERSPSCGSITMGIQGMPIVTETSLGCCGCWIGLLEHGPQSPDLVLPLDIDGSSEAGCVEETQLPGVTLIHCPHFTGVKQRREYYCPVHLQLGL